MLTAFREMTKDLLVYDGSKWDYAGNEHKLVFFNSVFSDAYAYSLEHQSGIKIFEYGTEEFSIDGTVFRFTEKKVLVARSDNDHILSFDAY